MILYIVLFARYNKSLPRETSLITCDGVHHIIITIYTVWRKLYVTWAEQEKLYTSCMRDRETRHSQQYNVVREKYFYIIYMYHVYCTRDFHYSQLWWCVRWRILLTNTYIHIYILWQCLSGGRNVHSTFWVFFCDII